MKKTSILVIEDEKKLLKALTDFFTIHEYQVYKAENGLEGHDGLCTA